MMHRSFLSIHRILSSLVVYLLLHASSCHALANNNAKQQQQPKTYNYFAFGSNMASSTMINLRNITPLASSAAILPRHALRFNIPGVPGVEPSSAAVEPVDTDQQQQQAGEEEVAHGVLYKLTESDFATICSTEGVPFGYSLHRCRVIPYVGDGNTAGQDALDRALSMKSSDTTNTNGQSTIKKWGVPAFTLRAARKEWRQGNDTPPSQSYLNVLIRGAKEFALDESYLRKLENIPVGKTWIGNGLAEEMLRVAEKRNR